MAFEKALLISIALCFITSIESKTLRDPYKCGQPECHPGNKLKYSTSEAYSYKYNVAVQTWFSGTSENRSTLDIETNVMIQFKDECEGVLVINNTTMKDLDENYHEERQSIFAAKLQEHHLTFAFHDGIITEICPNPEDDDWVINFKRGILSLFQNSMTRFDIDFSGTERDIHGTCNTQYRMKGQENTGLILIKTKDLAQCIDRYKYLSILQTVRYNFQSKYQTWPVLKSENQCEITIDHNVYTKVQCEEKHLIEPFSGRNSGALTTVSQKLELIEENVDFQSPEEEPILSRQNLYHEHVPVAKSTDKELKSARDILKEICRLEESYDGLHEGHKSVDDSDQTLSGVTVALWGNLVKACRGLQPAQLHQLLLRSNTICRQGKKYIYDALPYIASIGSVQMIKNMTLKGTIDESTRQEWLMSLSMIPRPRKEMIVTMGELLKTQPTDKIIAFATSAMVHSYCRNSKKTLKECCQEEQNLEIIDIFENNVRNILTNPMKTLTREERETITISIKSLGNMGGFSDGFRNLLMKIIEDSLIPLAIRVHTIDAFRRTSCSEMRDYFLELFREQSVNVEIRIASYLQVMRCPEYVTMIEILNILKREKINQVASFVWSHLENLDKSTIPSRVEKQALLASNPIPKPKQRPDFRKFSRNYEHGIFFDQYNTGANYEANVIMSPDSYIPRSVSVNFTVDMFGESINILEMNLRGEGFERYVENMLKNPFADNKIYERVTDTIRMIRSTSQAENIKKRVDTMDYKNDALNHRYPILDLGVKVFGNEISYWSVEGDKEMKDTLKEFNPLHHINKFLSGNRILYKKASLFLDTTYSVPTGTGLPMTLHMMGTSIANLNISGSISDLDIFSKTKNLNFEGRMFPSMALGIVTTMRVDAGGFLSTGIRVNLNVHTATALAANLKLEDGKQFRMNVSLPQSKQEIFEAKSELIVLHGTKEVKQTGMNKKKIEKSTCSWSIVEKAIGVKICASYEFPNMTKLIDPPYFILAGPIWYRLSLEKVDATAKIYTLSGLWDDNDSGKTFAVTFNTPNSKEKRTFDASLTYNNVSGKAMMNFHANKDHITAHASYNNLPENKSFECVLNVNGEKYFDSAMSLYKEKKAKGYIYYPTLHIAINNEKVAGLSGTLHMVEKGEVSQCDVLAQFETKRLTSRLMGYITWNGPTKATNLKLDYKFLKAPKQTIKMEGLISNRDNGRWKDFYGELGFEFSAYPNINFHTNMRYTGKYSHMDLTYRLSGTKKDIADNPAFNCTISYHDNIVKGLKWNVHGRLRKPYIDLNVNYLEEDMLKLFSVVVNYDKKTHLGETAGVWVRTYTPEGIRLYLEVDVNATMPSFTPLEFSLKVHEKKKHEVEVSAKGTWFTGVNATVDAHYIPQKSPDFTSHHVKSIITSNSFEDIGLDIVLNQDNKQINVNLKADQGTKKYGFIGRYIHFSQYNISCYGQVDFESKSYSVNVLADLNNDILVVANVHLDQIRDVHIKYKKINKPNIKQLNAVFNWDANRDPNKKLSVGYELLNKGRLNYGGSFMIQYPGRLINGEFDMLFKELLWEWMFKLGWTPDDHVYWKVKMYTEMNNETIYALLSELDTPFENWRISSLNIIWRYLDNYQSFNGNMTWDKQRIAVGFLSDYLFKTNEMFAEINTFINSSLKALPTVSVVAKHHHLWKKTSDTYLGFQYNNDGLIMMNSSWKLDRASHAHQLTNITGRVVLKSPFKGYKSGQFLTRFSFGNKKDISGTTDINLEDQTYKIIIDGHTKRFTNSMLKINISTSIPEYELIVTRLGIVDTDRHIVAMIKMPNTSIGVEGLLQLNSYQDFHIFGNLALPVEFFHNTLLNAKRSHEEVDFRVGLENMIFGFTGIWHYKFLTDFQYVYKLYTPLQGFEENGIVFRNIINDGMDTEISLRLSKHKIGAAVIIRENGKPLKEVWETMNMPKDSGDIIDDFSMDVYSTIDTIMYETVILDVNFKKRNDENAVEIVELKGNLLLPNQTRFTLNDKITIINLGNITNDLDVTTPYQSCSKIKFINTVYFEMGMKYDFNARLLIQDNKEWKENMLKIFYEHDMGEDDEVDNHNTEVKLVTQSEILPYLHIETHFINEEGLTKYTALFDMSSCQIHGVGQYEIESDSFNLNGAVNVTSPYLDPYVIQIGLKNSTGEIENKIWAVVKVQSGSEKNYIKTEVTWHPNSTDYCKLKVKASLIPVISPSEVELEFNKRSGADHMTLKANAWTGSKDMKYELDAEKIQQQIKFQFTSPHKGFKKVNFVSESKDDKIVGSFKGDSVTYDISGDIKSRNPLEIIATLRPTSNAETFTLRISSSKEDKKYKLIASLIGRIQFTLQAKYTNEDFYKEFHAKLDSSNQRFEEFYINSSLAFTDEYKNQLKLTAVTPFSKLRVIDISSDIELSGDAGKVIYDYNLTSLAGKSDVKWSFNPERFYIRGKNSQVTPRGTKNYIVDSYFTSNNDDAKEPIDAGVFVNLNHAWKIGVNGTVLVNAGNVSSLICSVLLPQPNTDIHTIKGYLDNRKDVSDNTASLSYTTNKSLKIAEAVGKLRNIHNYLKADLSTKYGTVDHFDSINNVLQVNIVDDKVYHYDYTLISPMYGDEETVKFNGTYEMISKDLVGLMGVLKSPASRQLMDMDVKFGGWTYSVAKINTTTPFEAYSWIAADARLSNKDVLSENTIILKWPNNTASIDMTESIKKINDQTSQSGKFKLVFPINKIHTLEGNYRYEETNTTSDGSVHVMHNKKQFLQGDFKQVTEKIDGGFMRDTINTHLDNDFKPIGIKYIHSYNDKGNDIKEATIFDYKNSSKLNISGKLEIEPWKTGKRMIFTTFHEDKTMRFENNYELKNRELFQGSKVIWPDGIWFAYDVSLINKTKDNIESQEVRAKIQYPDRTFGVMTVYNIKETLLNTTTVFKWTIDEKNKMIKLKGLWDNPDIPNINLHDVTLSLAHPSLNKDITLSGKYSTDSITVSNTSVKFDYSDYPDNLFNFNVMLRDDSAGSNRKYIMDLECTHPATNLDVVFKSNIDLKQNYYHVDNYFKYQKESSSEITRQGKVLLNLKEHTLLLEQTRDDKWYSMHNKWDLVYPEYKYYFTVDRTYGNESGIYVLSIKDRSTFGHYNRSDDSSYHMIGKINDARSADLIAWTDMGNDINVDVSSYIRLNHSKLLMSKIAWRPEMYQQIKDGVTFYIKDLSEQSNEIVSLIIKIPVETHRALSKVYDDMLGRIDKLKADLEDVHKIKEDFDNFQTSLNESYTNNEFYIKDVIEFWTEMIGKLSLQDHIESLPDIVNEIWQKMGDTGKSLIASLQWITDTITNSYANFTNNINEILDEGVMNKVADLIESGIRHYDTFIRNLHLSFIHYCEQIWDNVLESFNTFWKSFLKTIEPTYVHLAHYFESFTFKFGTEILDFFYARTTELTETPFFASLTKLGRDIDIFWKDIHSREMLENIQIYSNKAWNFVKSHILVHIPFQKEFKEIWNELNIEANRLRKLPYVKNVEDKLIEAKESLKWWYDYFKIGDIGQYTLKTIYRKIMEGSKKALQVEESHREAKTNFIYEPKDGLLLLEQKLPMPWHAFNRTPDFSEINEYRRVKNFVNDWILSNYSISFYYQFKLYTDMNNLLPPFAGNALMTGYGTIVTFDGRVYNLKEPGLYLLTADFWMRNFTILIKSNLYNEYDLILLGKKNQIVVNLFSQILSLDGASMLNLPIEIDGWFIHRNEDELKIRHKDGVQIDCNYKFKTCIFKVDGNYFSRVGGLFGTMNHEAYDDMSTPNGEITTRRKFIESWKIFDDDRERPSPNPIKMNDSLCESYFMSTVSPLKACFSMIDGKEFYDICKTGMDVCTLANAYVQLCEFNHVPLRVPTDCLKCTTPNGTIVEESSFADVTDIPKSTDVVFIVETHECNKNLRRDKNLDTLIDTMETQLNKIGLTNNRYSVMAYGSGNLYKSGQLIYVNNKLFTNAKEISAFFDYVQIERNSSKYRSYVFEALSKAAKLEFKPGVSKIFVLFPCTRCDYHELNLDYEVIQDVLLDSSITLHVVMEHDFIMSKRRVLKTIYGVDLKTAYTSKDVKAFNGNNKVRPSVSIPKSAIGACAPLALETNGTIFSGLKMKSREASGKNVATVMGTRIALNSNPFPKAQCECHANKLKCLILPRRSIPSELDDVIMTNLFTSEEIEDYIDQFSEIWK